MDIKSVTLEGIKVLAQYAKSYIDQKCSDLQDSIDDQKSRFDVLADEYCIYKGIEDSDGAGIEDSNGVAITGKVVYSIK